MVSPGRETLPAGAVFTSAKGPVSRILSCAVIPLGAASPRTLISDLPGRFGTYKEPPGRTGPVRSRSLALPLPLPSLFGLAPCGVYPAPTLTGRAVRSYRTISPLPRRQVSKLAQGGFLPERRKVAEAVSFLWHWPSMSFKAHVPDVIRHTALRSSDFPPPAELACASPPAATARSPCQSLVYRESPVANSSKILWPFI